MNWVARKIRWWLHIRAIQNNQARINAIVAVVREETPGVQPLDTALGPKLRELMADCDRHLTEMQLISIDERTVRRRW